MYLILLVLLEVELTVPVSLLLPDQEQKFKKKIGCGLSVNTFLGRGPSSTIRTLNSAFVNLWFKGHFHERTITINVFYDDIPNTSEVEKNAENHVFFECVSGLIRIQLDLWIRICN